MLFNQVIAELPESKCVPVVTEPMPRLRKRMAGAGDHVVARPYPGTRQIRRDDVAYRRLGNARWHGGIDPPPHEWVGNDGKPIYFDSIDNSAYILGKGEHSARRSWIYIDGEAFEGVRADVAGDPNETWVNVAWKMLYSATNSWLGVVSNTGATAAVYNLTMDPFEKYDMLFNGAAPMRVLSTSPGKWSGQDDGWALAVLAPPMIEFDKTLIKFPNIRRFLGGASTDLIPNLQNPDNRSHC